MAQSVPILVPLTTVKKSPAQLEREIAETLRGAPKGARDASTYLYVEGVGHRLRNGYEIHWNWIARRDGKQIDGGALTGGDLPEFYETWPDHRGQTAIIEQLKKILREWIRAGEFGTDLSSKISVSLSKSSSDVPSAGHSRKRAHASIPSAEAAEAGPTKENLQRAAKWIRRELTKRTDSGHPSHLARKVLEEADEKFKLGSFGVEGWAKSPSIGYQYLNYGDPYDATIVVRSNQTRATVIVALGGWASYAGNA